LGLVITILWVIQRPIHFRSYGKHQTRLEAFGIDQKKKELDGLRDVITSEKYPRWRNLSLVNFFMNLKFKTKTSQAVELNKRKIINNEEELREQLERLQVELGTNKALKISFEEQLFTEEKLRKFVK